jgi:GTP cyclohydrolase I
MAAKRKSPAPDVQARRDRRRIEIDRVGVKDILYPITVLDRRHKTQRTVARVSMTVNLPHQFRGTHMSRFVELLNEHCQDMSTTAIPDVLLAMKDRLRARAAQLEVAFPYFILKRAPVSGAEGLLAYACTVRGEARRRVALEIEVQVPITALCPCSKAISDRGAHSQRGLVTVRYRQRRFVWIEEIIDAVERSASCEIFSVLKRADEKYVTERAYAHPMFVEDVARAVAQRLQGNPRIAWFSVEVENQESIHAHNAYAFLESAGGSWYRHR